MAIDGAAARGRAARIGLLKGLGLGVSLTLALGGAHANPLTEAPGLRAPETGAPARDEAAEAAEARAANPSATAIIRALAPFADGNPGAPSRPLRVAPDDGGPALSVDAGRAVDLTVFFAYDSARLTPEARIQLEPLGQALGSRQLSRHGFLIAGHTDAAGTPAYNRRLSLARARAVKAHLVEVYGIDPDRLRVHGWGPSRPRDPSAPLARINRRVEVSLIAPRTGALSFIGPVAAAACAPHHADPRHRVVLDLDDFDAAPTALPCAD
ncbi:OmpA family protein [Methylobacterium isbiliense]|jgi:outer membrane protein OmpA-like peptidoglycan-associated protein|uniref:Peptidoglycan-associated lipoprotein n=1 Tax=Methylobacterium isbiliense TaxID=315478 RepID=A0ABQ4SHM5_9HYPH|nr:OmpA family protein [Methylobacterium isbiliense]MDN3625648.1 OmpA family protein [Methylobacterium isbiliense]GJE01918.1 Peptidoglycan-associated lipoprotein [Methylobacterium isbiliense]